MSIDLQKGQKIALCSENSSALRSIIVGLGWNTVKTGRIIKLPVADIDCDAAALLCDKNGKLCAASDIVYYGARTHDSGSVVHQGNHETTEKYGDNEQITINLTMIPDTCSKIIFCVNIYECEKRGQNFGMLRDAYIRLTDADTNTELCRFTLPDEYADKTAVILGAVSGHRNAWRFTAIGEGTTDKSLKELSQRYR